MIANRNGSPRSLSRVIGLFHVIADGSEGMSLAKLSAKLGAPKSSLLTLLRPLVSADYLAHDGGLYRLGPSIFRLASDILSSRSFTHLVRPFMLQLVERSNESVYLALLDRPGLCVTYVEGIHSPQAVRYMAPIGAPRPLYCSAAGRLLLAYQEDAWRNNYVRTAKLKAVTEHTLTSRAQLRGELEKIRRAGVAVSIGEAVPGAAGLAAPIFDTNGNALAALLIGAPANRFERELPALRKLIKEVAAKASGIFAGPIS